MVPGTGSEWQWFFNNLFYSAGVFFIRWLMPRGIREACYLGEVQILEGSYPPRDEWLQELAEGFEIEWAEIQRQYRVNT